LPRSPNPDKRRAISVADYYPHLFSPLRNASARLASSLLAALKIFTKRFCPRLHFVSMVPDRFFDHFPQKGIGDVALEYEPDGVKSFVLVHD
jgi:hypothetical protein